MLVTYYVRGNLFAFTATFLDVNEQEVEPETVALTIDYLLAGVRTAETIALDPLTDGSFYGAWDSSVADRGRVDWAVRAQVPPAADEGTFTLTANLANIASET